VCIHLLFIVSFVTCLHSLLFIVCIYYLHIFSVVIVINKGVMIYIRTVFTVLGSTYEQTMNGLI
jgi:hypothetical protein